MPNTCNYPIAMASAQLMDTSAQAYRYARSHIKSETLPLLSGFGSTQLGKGPHKGGMQLIVECFETGMS